MVKVTHKTIQKANLRQSIRPKINRINLHQVVRQPLAEHNTNIPNIRKFSLCQSSAQNFNIQNDNQDENSSIGEDNFNENNDNNNISDYFDENYDDDDQENYFYQDYHYQEEELDEYEDNCDNNTDDISFVFKD